MKGLLLLLIALTAQSENGEYGVPGFNSISQLTNDQRRKFEDAAKKLSDPTFVDRPGLIHRPSATTNKEEMDELKKLADKIIGLGSEYGGIVAIGRSNTGLMGFLEGVKSEGGSRLPHLKDIPYSNSTGKLTAEERAQLRRHLTRNHLTPREIAERKKPILFLDFAYSATGSLSLLEEIYRWGREQGLAKEVKANVHFLGIYSPRLISDNRIWDIYYASKKEGSSASPPSEERLEAAAKLITLPNGEGFQKVAGKVHDFRISSESYAYWGSHAPNAHESFTREKWGENPKGKNLFTDHVGEPAYTELYRLYQLGKEHAQSKKGCIDKLGLLK